MDQNLYSILAELPKFIKDFDPTSFIDLIRVEAKKIRLLQATHDDVVPLQLNKSFITTAGIDKYKEINDNHYFLNREIIIPTLIEMWDDSV